jgi:hypothetical protein
MPPAEASALAADGAAYEQPTPQQLYVHDDLSDLVARRLGAESPAAELTRELFALLVRRSDRVRVLTLAEQLDRVESQGAHAPFELAIGIGRAGERVAQALHARTGWFPRIMMVGLTREEDGRGGYRLASTEAKDLRSQLEGVGDPASLAIVDDTVFSGLTMRGVLEGLSPAVRARTHAFCLRGVTASIESIAALCPITAGVSAAGRLLDDVSFINASGLVLRISIRRQGQPPLAFFDRPDWIRAWFPGADAEVLAVCRRLNALLEGAG